MVEGRRIYYIMMMMDEKCTNMPNKGRCGGGIPVILSSFG
jgi:hypothetical protein